MPATYEPIATTTLGSAASTITFSSIPSTYTDLRLVLVAKSDSTPSVLVRYNSDSGSNYSRTFVGGDGSSAFSVRSTNATSIDLNSMDTTQPILFTMDIFSYAGSTNKTALCEHNGDKNGSGNVVRYVALWRSTSAINTITLLTSSNNYATGTTAILYGILKA